MGAKVVKNRGAGPILATGNDRYLDQMEEISDHWSRQPLTKIDEIPPSTIGLSRGCRQQELRKTIGGWLG